MSDQVIGFFKNVNDAQQAAAALVRAGIDRSAIRILAHEGAAPAAAEHHEGMWQRIKEFFGAADETEQGLYHEAYRRGNAALAVDAASQDEVERITDILEQQNSVDIDQQARQWQSEGWTNASLSNTAAASTATTTRAGARAPAPRPTAAASDTGREAVLPVVQEELQVGKRQVRSGGVRVYSRTTERPVNESVNLHEEHIHVERRPVDRPVTAGDRAFEERAIEATETREEAVVQKVARVVEEVVVRKDAEDRTQKVNDTVRRTDVHVEKVPTAQTTSPVTPTTPPQQTPRKNP